MRWHGRVGPTTLGAPEIRNGRRVLQDEGLLEPRQGSDTFVVVALPNPTGTGQPTSGGRTSPSRASGHQARQTHVRHDSCLDLVGELEIQFQIRPQQRCGVGLAQALPM
jgi:hypothetical protein